MKYTLPYYKNIQHKLDKISLQTRENLSGVRVVRAFSRQPEEVTKFINTTSERMALNIKTAKITSFLNPLTYTIFNFGIIAILWFGGIQVNIGSLSQGNVIALVNYMVQISHALVIVAQMVVVFTRAGASAIRINEILDSPDSKCEVINNTQNICDFSSDSQSNYKIQFKNVSFSYKGNKTPSLTDFSLNVKKGETIGIIGGTGSGKSTLVNLMPRFYLASKGEILIDGQNINYYQPDILRNKFGIVPQKSVLFKGTVKENLLWGKPDATDKEINNALEIAEAKQFVYERDDNIKSSVSQGGKNLSGGQRQRLSIARAVIKKPEILILDDSFSALDFQTDLKLRTNLKSYLLNTTTFIVSQRINSIKHADKIIVLDKGKIENIGTHEQLLESSPIYQTMYELQTSEAAL